MQRIVKRTFLVGGALTLLCAGLAGCGSSKAQSWTFTDDEGSIRRLSDYQGQVLVLGLVRPLPGRGGAHAAPP